MAITRHDLVSKAPLDHSSSDAKHGAASTSTFGHVKIGSGLSVSGGVISHSDTSAQASVSNTGAKFIQSANVDTYGHVTSLTSTTITPSLIGAANVSHTHKWGDITSIPSFDGGDADTVDGLHASQFLRSDANTKATGVVDISKLGKQDSNIFVPWPKGGEYKTNTSTVTGALKITLPVTWNNTMMKFTVEVYDYVNNKSFTMHIAGYNYSQTPGWNSTSAYMITNNTSLDYKVRFGHDGSKCCVLIGEDNSTWSYPQVVVKDFIGGYGNASLNSFVEGWSVGFLTSSTSITNVVTIANTKITARYANNADAVDGKHVDDNQTSASYLWTANKINTQLNTKVPTTRTISTTNGLTGGGALSGNLTIQPTYGGNGSANTIARSDHNHDTIYVKKTGGGTIGGATSMTDMLTLTGRGSVSNGALTDCALNIEHLTGNSSSIHFKSIANANSDYGYIRFESNDGTSGQTERARLTIGVENDVTSSTDYIRLQGRTVINGGNNANAASDNIVEFKSASAARGHIDKNGVFYSYGGTVYDNNKGIKLKDSVGNQRNGILLNNSNNMLIGDTANLTTIYTSGSTAKISNGSVTSNIWHDGILSFGGNGSASTMSRSDHNHDSTYLKLSGGTVTGNLTLNANLNIKGCEIKTGGSSNKSLVISAENENIYLRPIKTDTSKELVISSTNVTFLNNKMWHAGNDGAGSGLDADLLDGKQAADFALSTHNHDGAYLKLAGGTLQGSLMINNASSTTSGLVVRRNTVDSESMRMYVTDALGAIHYKNDEYSSEFRITVENTDTEAGDGSRASTNNFIFQSNNTGANILVNANKVWHAGNDGAGSGLDADLLDGKQASAFALSSHTHNTYLASDANSKQTISGANYHVRSASTTKRFTMQFNDAEGSLDFVYYDA